MPDPGPLLEEEVLLRRSLEDLDREHAAGEIEDVDYESLRARYSARAEAVAASLRDLDSAPLPPPRAPRQPKVAHWIARHRRRVIGAAVACFVVAAAVLSLALGGVPPFAAASNPLSVAARIRIELGEAGVLASNHDVAQAIALYDDVLALEPRQPEALADGGWLIRLGGLEAHSQRLIRAGDLEIALAVRVDPRYALAQAYEGVVLSEDGHDPAGAVARFKAMLADGADPTLLRSVRPYAEKAFRAAGDPLPAGIAAG